MRVKIAVLTTIAVLFLGSLATVPGPTTYRTESGVKNGGHYTAIFKVPGRPLVDIRAHAQGAGYVYNPRIQASVMIYEMQEFGAATTATAAAAGAVASDTLTWGIPFQDNNYSVACQLSGTVTAVPTIVSNTHTATAVTKTHAAVTAAAASNAAPGFDCIAVHQ